MGRTPVWMLVMVVACSGSEATDKVDDPDPPIGVDVDGDGVVAGDDCDDEDAAVYPGAAEVCDGADNNCDGAVDEDLPAILFWPDADGDGFGDLAATSVEACAPPPGHVADGTDCDDTTPAVSPDQQEVCDGLDNDCTGGIDDGLPVDDYYVDDDGDGHGAGTPVSACGVIEGYAAADTDCDDTRPDVSPDATELCDGIDNDCDADVDGGIGGNDWWPDIDGDTYGDMATPPTDRCLRPPGMVDNDLDCDDEFPSINPDGTEICDGRDNDCDGAIDDDTGPDYWPDADGDGFGDPTATPTPSCTPLVGHSVAATDCDDGNSAVHPGADTDVCDLVDTDCDGVVEDQSVPSVHATIAAAVAAAPANGLICLEPGTHVENVYVNTDVRIEGVGGPAAVTVDGGGSDGVFWITSADVELRGMTIRNGFDRQGAGIDTYASDLLLDDVVVADNVCTSASACFGVGVHASTGGSLTIRSSTIRDNTGTDTLGLWSQGGGLRAYDTDVVLSDTRIEGNTLLGNGGFALAHGAGVYVETATLTADRVEIWNNTLAGLNTGVGAGLALRYAEAAVLDHVDIAGNVCEASGVCNGGGLSAENTDVFFTNGIVAGNAADADYSADGGGILQALTGAFVTTNVAVVGNTAAGTGDGNGWYSEGSSPTLVNTVIEDNVRDGSGSGFFADGVTPSVMHCAASGNDGGDWGGMTDPTGAGGNLADPASFVDTSGDPTTWDLHLQGGSTLIDAGDPSLDDPDGSRSDIGPYGGPLGASW